MKISELQRMLQYALRRLDERRRKTNNLLDQVKMEYEERIQELHAAVDEAALPSCFQQGAAARDLVVGSQKCELHRYTSQFGFAPLV